MATDDAGPAVGNRAEAAMIVEESDTAIALGSGDVPVLGTPRLMALCEAATVASVADRIGPSQTTVGIEVALHHTAPSFVGSAVRAVAVLNEIEGRILRFTVEAFEGGKPVGRGLVVRAIVDRDSLLGSS